MILISHRGNLTGKNVEKENHPDYINIALKIGFDVEIDLWLINDKLYLGHDSPQYETNLEYLKNDKLWVHCKNSDALNFCIQNKGIHYFWHEDDDYTLTSNLYVWAYPKVKPLSVKTIAVLPELGNTYNLKDYCGVCSDFIVNYI
jgi:hypothetical protein